MRHKVVVKYIVICLLISIRTAFSQDPTAAKIDELLSAYAKSYKLNGTVLVARGGKVIFTKGYGFRNVKDSSLNNTNTIYQLGSITKQFTATVILKLAEQKK